MAVKVNPTPNLPTGLFSEDPTAIQQIIGQMLRSIFLELKDHATRLNNALIKDGSEGMTAPIRLASFTVAGVPTASLWTGAMIYVSNETGGAVPAFSDGTNWRRVTDRAIVS